MKRKTAVILGSLIFFFNSTLSFANPNENVKDYRLSFNQKLNDFDPINADSLLATEISANLFSTLFTYRTTVGRADERVTDLLPGIAESWTVSADRKTYNFRLKKDFFFSNGRNLEAFDVKKTIERLAQPKYSENKFRWLFADFPVKGIKKYQEQIKKKSVNPDLEGVKVVDPQIVQIILDKPSPLIFKILALPQLAIIPKEELERKKTNFASQPVGAGPYYLEKSQKELIVLKKNPYYSNKEKVYPEKISYHFAATIENEFAFFNSGKLEQTGIPDQQMTEILQKEQMGRFSLNFPEMPAFNERKMSELIKEPKLISTFIGINQKNPLLKNLKFRQAINHAVNKQEIIAKDLSFKADELKGVFPENFPGVGINLSVPYPYNLNKAKKLLYETGVFDYNNDGFVEYKSKPVQLNLWFYDDPETEKVCQAIQKNLKEVGIKVNLKKSKDWDKFLKTVSAGNADLFHFTWKAKYPDPDKLFTPMFHSKNIGGTNIFSYKNNQVDQLLDKAYFIDDDEFRYPLYRQAESLIVADAPWLFLYQPVKYVKVQPYVYGLKLHPVFNNVVGNVYFSEKPFD